MAATSCTHSSFSDTIILLPSAELLSMARICAEATSLTSTIPICILGVPGTEPLIMFFTSEFDVPTSLDKVGPITKTGFITVKLKSGFSISINSQAASSAMVLLLA